MTIPLVVPASTTGPARRGFSLIELLVVIAIIAIIVAIIVPALGGVRITGKAATTRTLMGSINSAVASFQQDERRLPGYFSQQQMGSDKNGARGFTAMQNVLLDLSGGVQGPATGAGKVGSVRVGPGSALVDQIWVDPNLIGTSNQGSKYYFVPTAKNLIIAGDEKQHFGHADNRRLGDLVDAFGTPIMAWVENETAVQPVTTIDDFAQENSTSPTKPQARFYWNTNAGLLKAQGLGKLGKNQLTDSGLTAGGSYPSTGELSGQQKAQVLAGFLGNPGFPNVATAKTADVLPDAARGKFIVQSAGADGIYLSKYDTKGKGFGGQQIKYGYYFSPKGNPGTDPYLDSSGRTLPNDFIAKFDDLLVIGGS